MLCVKQGDDLTWEWTVISLAIDEHSTHRPIGMWYGINIIMNLAVLLFYIDLCVNLLDMLMKYKLEMLVIVCRTYGKWCISIIRVTVPLVNQSVFIFNQPLRSGRIWHLVNFYRSLTGLNSEFSFS